MISPGLLAILIWTALIVVGAGAIYLLVILIRELVRGELW